MTKAKANEDLVRHIQRALGLTEDGWGGDKTRAAFDALMASKAAGAEPLDPNDALLIAELEDDEGRVLHAYQDSLGYWTIGIGRLIDKRKGGGISNAEADYLKRNDIAKVKADLDRVAPWWRQIDPVRQRAIQNMTFNLGAGWITPGHKKAWPNTVALMRAGRWREAAAAIRANKVWTSQVGARAERIARQIESGS